jgi:hypothetical protein
MTALRLFLIIAFIIVSGAFGFAQKKVSLLIAEYDEQASDNHLQHLVKYVFVDGAMVSKEPIVSALIKKKGEKNDYVRFDVGKNKIYRNRYVVTGIGNIIDIKNKKILFDEHAPFVAFSGDSIIFYTDDIFKGKYYSIYNLKTQSYYKVEDPHYNPAYTPDVEVDATNKPFVINYYDVAGKKNVLVKDAGYGEAPPATLDKVKRKHPIFWIDKRNFIYANFDKSQQSLSIYKVGINGVTEKITTIDSVPAAVENTFFEYAANGDVIYSCGKGRFIIDLAKKKTTKIEYENVGNDFFVESVENKNYGRKIKYEDAEIGKRWCRYENVKTTKDYIACENDMVVETEHYFQGVTVWNTSTKKWTTLKVFQLANIVGWVEEE